MSNKSGQSAAAPAGTGKFSFTPVYWIVLVVYALTIFYGISNHEPWRDEAQSWLMVRELSLFDVLRMLPAEGHPPLWYLLIYPFAHAGAPYVVQAYITAAIMIGTVYLLLFRTKLPIYLKLALVFSYFFVFEYAVIARSYCLVAFFITAIIAFYGQRFTRPGLFALLVIGLFNSQMLAFTFAAAVAGVYFLDCFQYREWRRPTVVSFVAMCIGGAYLIPYIVLSSPTSTSFQNRITDHGEQIKNAIGNAFFTYGEQSWALLSLALLCILLLARPKALLILIGGLAGVFYILGYKYTGTVRHQGILFLEVLGALGIAYWYKDDRFSPKIKGDVPLISYIVLTLTLLFQVRGGVASIGEDAEKPFSDARAAADFLLEHNLEGRPIVGYKAYAASAVVPFLPKGTQFFYPECKQMGSYLDWNPCYMEHMFDYNSSYAAYVADSTFGNRPEKPVLVLNAPIEMPQVAERWELKFASSEQPMRRDEAFFIYVHK